MIAKALIIDHPRSLLCEHYNDVVNAPLSASLNTGYVYSVIKKTRKYDVSYLDFNRSNIEVADIVEQTIGIKPNLLLIHWVYNWDNSELVLEYIQELRKSKLNITIVAFGYFPTFCYKEVLGSGVDCVIVGEIEKTLEELLLSLASKKDYSLIKGIATKSSFSPRYDLIEDLDKLPYPEDLGKTAQLKHINVFASRGCYQKCSFCSVHPYYSSSKWRGRSPENIVDEIKFRLKKRDTFYVYFCDPNFFGPGKLGQKRVQKIAELLTPLKIKFGLETSVKDINLETTLMLANAGLDSVFLGIESASIDVLKRMNKKLNPADSANAIKILREANVRVSLGFIMFEPNSTLEDIKINYRFLEENNLLVHHDMTSNLLYHNQIVLKGTPSFESYKTQGRLKMSEISLYEGKPTYLNPSVDSMQKSMSEISLCYFKNMDKLWREQEFTDIEQFESCHHSLPMDIPEDEINLFLKSSFTDILSLCKNGKLSDIPSYTQNAVYTLNELLEPLWSNK